jgi:hypothetical protein
MVVELGWCGVAAAVAVLLRFESVSRRERTSTPDCAKRLSPRNECKTSPSHYDPMYVSYGSMAAAASLRHQRVDHRHNENYDVYPDAIEYGQRFFTWRFACKHISC